MRNTNEAEGAEYTRRRSRAADKKWRKTSDTKKQRGLKVPVPVAIYCDYFFFAAFFLATFFFAAFFFAAM